MNDSKSSTIPEWARRLIDDPLELPIDPEFRSVPPQLSVKQMIELSERYLPAQNSRPDFVEMKLARIFPKPFEL